MRIKSKIKSLLGLPSPTEIGASSDFALPSRAITPDTPNLTWEDYDDYLHSRYPVRSFLALTLPDWLDGVWWKVWRPLKDAHYWLVSHTIRPYHLLDLRQPKPGYRYGWIDSDTQMEYALFGILNAFVAVELQDKYLFTEDEIVKCTEDSEREWMSNSRSAHLEMLAIHHWWNVERPAMQSAMNAKLDEWSSKLGRIVDRNPNLLKEYGAMEEELLKSKEEMMIRLIKIRSWMWT